MAAAAAQNAIVQKAQLFSQEAKIMKNGSVPLS
jgi:hypothetical protein